MTVVTTAGNSSCYEQTSHRQRYLSRLASRAVREKRPLQGRFSGRFAPSLSNTHFTCFKRMNDTDLFRFQPRDDDSVLKYIVSERPVHQYRSTCTPLCKTLCLYCRQRGLATKITCHAADWQFPGYGSRGHSSEKPTGSRKRPKVVREKVDEKKPSKKKWHKAKDKEPRKNALPEVTQRHRNEVLLGRRYITLPHACTLSEGSNCPFCRALAQQ